jgi:hypothetical protein
MHLSPLAYVWYYLWIAPHLILPAIALLVWRRGWHRQFPCFFAYLIYESVLFLTIFWLSQFSSISELAYRSIDACSMIGSIGLRFAVVYEIFRHVFQLYPSLIRTGRMLFAATLVILLLLAIAVGLYQAGGNADRMSHIATTMGRSMSLIQCGLLAFLLFFSSYFRLSWNSFSLGIAVGLGVFASVDLATMAVLAEISPVSRSTRVVFDFITMGTYHGCVLIWLGYLLVPKAVLATDMMPIHDLDSWSDELQRLVQR